MSDSPRPHPCCVPSKERLSLLEASRKASWERLRVTTGSTEEMVQLDGSKFLMGTESNEGFPADGEGPVREVTLDPFYIDRYPVTNRRFEEFVCSTGYKTESERFGWSFVFYKHIPPEAYDTLVDRTVPGVEWWCKVKGADWRHPEGPATHIDSRPDHPAVHISWNDAAAY